MTRALAVLIALVAGLAVTLPLGVASGDDGGYGGGSGGYTTTTGTTTTTSTTPASGGGEGNYDPGSTQPVVVGGANGGQVTAYPGTFSAPRTIQLAPVPAGSLPPLVVPGFDVAVAGVAFDLTITDPATGAVDHGGSWDPPLALDIDFPTALASVPDSSFAPAYYDAGASPAAWHAIPALGAARNLAAGARDGFYLTGVGAARVMHILTRHATYFANFVVVKRAAARVPAHVRSKLARSLRVRHSRITVPCQPSGTGVVACRVQVRIGKGRHAIRAGSAVGRGHVTVRLSKAAMSRIRHRPASAHVTLQAVTAAGKAVATLRRTVRLHR